MKINPIINNKIARYHRKTTLNSMYNRSVDMALFSSLGFGVQLLRIPYWQIPDIGITAALGSMSIKSIVESFKYKIKLQNIKKRAQLIKNSKVINA